MGWPYEFLTLSDQEKQLRRHSLDHYASIAHYSAFAPALIFLLCRLVSLVTRRASGGKTAAAAAGYEAVPGSPVVKAARRGSGIAGVEATWSRVVWWMGDEVWFRGENWGQKGEWVMGVSWTVWLLVLCVLGTGKDYLHLTKRFGLIAASQLPIQYLLALKALNPFAWVFGSSHEQVNRYHRVLGRIVYLLLILHAVFYNIFFVGTGIWWTRFFAPVVFAGVVAAVGLHALAGTAMVSVRRWSYRVFFVTHLAAAMMVPPLIFFHAPSARFYVVEAIAVFLVDLGVRKGTTIAAPVALEEVHGTNLLKITATLPLSKMSKFQGHPGSHIYLSIPPNSRPSTNPTSPSFLLYEFMYNPFSVFSTSEQSGMVTLIARNRAGPVTNHLAVLSSANAKATLNIEGPYGAAGKTFASLLSGHYDRVLLFAGGVGATFALPIYHAILHDNPAAKVKLIWAVRTAGEATWATSSTPDDPAARSVLDDNNVQLFLTGDMGIASIADDNTSSSAGVEMGDLRRGRSRNSKRPDVSKIVSDTFRLGLEESVAVLVCGPEEMAREVRRAVRPWVMKGRRVWWHNEAFGW